MLGLVSCCPLGVSCASIIEFAPRAPDWWVSGRTGTLSPWAQAQVFALCWVSAKLGVSYTDPDLALEVCKVGGDILPRRLSGGGGTSLKKMLTGTLAKPALKPSSLVDPRS